MGFGDFDFLCKNAVVPLCSLVGPYTKGQSNALSDVGVMPGCYARSIELANTIIFEVGSAFIHIASVLVLAIMIFNIKSKYTAIGRVEILHFFYLFLLLIMLSLVIDSGVTPPKSATYPYFAAVQAGVTSACCWSLMYNGFLGFQFWEDGTQRSLWSLRFISVGAFALSFIVALFTFQSWGTLGPQNTLALFVVLYIVNALCIVIWFVSQVILCVFILHDIWALGAVVLGAFFFIVGQVLLYAFSELICDKVKHYLDGLFFATLCNLFAMMMVYKYWDMVTKEDLEFSVSNKDNAWEVKELMDDYGSEYAPSTYGLQQHHY